MVDKIELCEKLINTYPNSIVEDDGELNFEETAYNFASDLMDEVQNFKQRKKYFGRDFIDIDDCYRWIINELPELYEMCFNFLNKDYE